MIRPFAVLLLGLLLWDNARAETVHVLLSSSGAHGRISIGGHLTRNILIRHLGDRVDLIVGDVTTVFVVSGHAPLVIRSTTNPGELHLKLLAHASLRSFRIGIALVIDIFPPAPTPPLPLRPMPALSGLTDLVPGLPTTFAARLDNASSVPSLKPDTGSSSVPRAPAAPPDVRSSASSGSGGLPIVAVSEQSPGPSQNILLPFSADVGVAAVRRHGLSIFYFDEPRPLDLSDIRDDPLIGRISVEMLPSYTVITLPTTDTKWVTLSHEPAGWRLAIATQPPIRNAISAIETKSAIRFHVGNPGKVLTATDPVTGATLLIGTDRAAQDAVLFARRSASFRLDRSQIGLVIEPVSDRLSLRAIDGGFALARDDGGDLALPQSDSILGLSLNITELTRSFDFPNDTPKDLFRRLQRQQMSAAVAASRARLGPRLAVAQTMLALGLTREARTVLRVAFADDPAASKDSHARLLQALAETIGGDNAQDYLADSSLPLSDELNLWRVLTRASGGLTVDADVAVVRADLPLILAYPSQLRQIAAGLAARHLLENGTKSALAAIAELPSTSHTMVAKAVARSAAGEQAAFEALKNLTKATDWGTAADAMRQLITLQLSRRQMSPAQAADALAAHRLDWRVTGQEGAALMQEAALRRGANQFAEALALWHEVERRFPDLAKAARANILQSLDHLSDRSVLASMTPADFVLAADDCAREFAAHQDLAAKLAPVLADRLEALDLPSRATATIRHVVDAFPPGVGKAVLSAKLASLLLEQNDLAGAQSALDQSELPGLTGTPLRERHLLRARLLELRGAHDQALAMIADEGDADALDLRVSIDEASGRWHEAKTILDGLSEHLPQEGTLAAKDADLVIRLATAASRDGDTALLVRLSRAVTGRFPDHDREQTFDFMTAPLMQAKTPSSPPDAG